jgi:trk system potassium uptake protein TrkH
MYVKVVAAIYLVFLIMLVCQGRTESTADLFIDPIFLIVSAITSTGFATCNYEVWGPMAMLLIMMLMFSGACAGSTTGGAKIDRLLFTSKNLRNETILSLYPGRVMTVNVNNKILFPEQITRITAFLSIYMIIVVIATLILAAFGIGFSDAIFAASSCMGNSGLGYGLTGADGSFAAIPDLGKWMLSAVMLLGRLEIFSVLVLFSSAFWRR